MSAGSLVGFALVAVIVSWAASAALGAAATAGRRRLARRGPAAERAGASLALLLPPVLGLAVTAALALGKLWAATNGGDHCLTHPHHLHLCLVHGGAWAGEAWALALLAAAGTAFLARLAAASARHLRAGRSLRRLARVSRPLADDARDVVLAPSALPFAFTAGLLRPRVYVSSALWDRLDGRQREALLAHERAHLRRGDVRTRVALELAGLLGAPFVAERLLAQWSAATERWCDAEAAARVADPLVVAETLVRVARLGAAASGGARPAGALSFTACRDDLGARVEALLAWDGREGRSRALAWSTAAAVALAAAAAGAFAHPLHHVFESLLGSF
jgi:Zn-dependent protease with chaperone function